MFESRDGAAGSGGLTGAPAGTAVGAAAGAPAGTAAGAAVGPGAVAALAAEPLTARPVEQLVTLLAGWERQAAWITGQQARVIAQIAAQVRAEAEQRDADEDGDGISGATLDNLVEAEIGTALRLSARTAAHRIDIAEQLTTDRLTPTRAALEQGRISYWQAVTILEETSRLTDLAARRVQTEVLPHAETGTTAGLRRRLRRAAFTVTPTDTSARARQATAAREVTLTPAEDGMAILRATGPAPALQALFHALDITAGRTPTTDPRPLTARRFDALTDLAIRTLDQPGCPPPPRVPATVHLTLDAATLLGLTDNPAHLHGYGPLPAPLARILAADNGWHRLIHDPTTGAPQDLGRTRRDPSAALADWIRLRDQSCTFPGCYLSAWRSQIDHRIRWRDGGRTDKDNLAPLCPKHHRVKHGGWTYTRHPDRITWTSPHHQTYTRYLPDPTSTCPDYQLLATLETQQHTSPHPHHDLTFTTTGPPTPATTATADPEHDDPDPNTPDPNDPEHDDPDPNTPDPEHDDPDPNDPEHDAGVYLTPLHHPRPRPPSWTPDEIEEIARNARAQHDTPDTTPPP